MRLLVSIHLDGRKPAGDALSTRGRAFAMIVVNAHRDQAKSGHGPKQNNERVQSKP